ncbi:aquaporin, partial [Staphylococcus aureus]
QFSGANLNPAVSLALALVGSLVLLIVPVFIVVLMLGASVGATIVWLKYLPHWKATDEAGAKFGVFSTA